jgi:hypothetical protein
MSIFATLATSVHINSGTYVFCAKVTEVIFEIIDRRRAPHWVGFGIHRDIDVADLPLTLALTKQWTFLLICLQQSNVR